MSQPTEHASGHHDRTSDRLPPQNLEAERGALGSLLLDPSRLAEVRPILAVDDLYRDDHRRIYRAMLAVVDAGTPCDPILVADRLTADGVGREAADELMAEMMVSVPHPARATYYAQVVRQKAIKRRAISIAGELERDGYSDAHNAETLLRRHAARIEGLGVDAAGRAGPVLVRLSDVEPEPVRWLWPGRLPLGKPSLFIGDPGLGKSFITVALAASVSTGAGWPDRPDDRRDPGSAIMLSAEDTLADTIRPRLDAAGADASRIHALTSVRGRDGHLRAFNVKDDLPRLEQALEIVGDARLVVIDPISAYLGESDEHKNAEIRALVGPLSDLADRWGIALVLITHLNKGSGSKAIYRATGSLAFVAAARVAWLVVKDRDDPTRRLMLPAKCNIASEPTGMAYRIADGAIQWETDPVTMHADDALAAEGGREDDDSKVARAAEWLELFLAVEPRPSADVFGMGRAVGHRKDTLYKAKAMLQVRARKVGFGKDAPWHWELPTAPAEENEGEPDL